MGMDEAGKKRRLDIQDLEEIRNDAHENEPIYKDKTKAFHDKMISRKVSLSGPFVVTNVFDHGAIEIKSEQTGKIFKVNGHRLKPFYDGFQVTNEEVELPRSSLFN
ncbi:uncharacterized protein LOC111896346 [Lactuca sativa]|uniref:uncharacterized protein LOC111896346 n=1 Tax=Lactuca sativa TaxID=4236 RepID=UPI000CD8BD0E|nr:uncharacterized protein LOC111896346 [Lactuca sativa]